MDVVIGDYCCCLGLQLGTAAPAAAAVYGCNIVFFYVSIVLYQSEVLQTKKNETNQKTKS